MRDDSLRELLTEHLPAPPPDMTEPPLAAIRRRARRRTGVQLAAVIAAVAAIATGTVVVVGDNGTATMPVTSGASLTDSSTVTSVRGHAAEVPPIGNGGLALTWLENGSRFSVSLEVPPDMQIHFVLE